MLYLSQLQGAPVEDPSGARVGKISDVLTTRDDPAQQNVLLVDGSEEHPWYVPVGLVEWRENAAHLRVPVAQLALQDHPSAENQVSLTQEVLDKQVIDLARKKAVRVNDVCLSEDWQVQGIDNSTLGLVRRLAPNWLLGASKRTPGSLIPWDRIELLGPQRPQDDEEAEPEHPLPLSQIESLLKGHRPSSGQLAELRPADIADIVHQLSPGQGARLIEGLDNETAADTLEEIDTERQSLILENIDANRAADILEEMGPDEAADLLARLPEERTQELLRLMTPEESEDVQELLEYEENSAGGLMTTDFVALSASKTVAEALNAIRASIQEDIRAVYVYCVPDEEQDECPLLGVVSLWDLLTATPTLPLKDLMKSDLITVQPDAEPAAVAEIMAKYNLLAVPVISPEGFLEGIVTVDDALDVLLPDERRRKPTRMY